MQELCGLGMRSVLENGGSLSPADKGSIARDRAVAPGSGSESARRGEGGSLSVVCSDENGGGRCCSADPAGVLFEESVKVGSAIALKAFRKVSIGLPRSSRTFEVLPGDKVLT